MRVAEYFLRPQVHTAFAGIAMRKFDHRDPLRPEKQQQRNKPQPDGHAPVGSDAGDNVQVEYGNDEQQHQVKASEDAFQVRLIVFGRGHNKDRVIGSSSHRVIGFKWPDDPMVR